MDRINVGKIGNRTFYKNSSSGSRIFVSLHANTGGTRWLSWLRHCSTTQKAAGSIPDSVGGIFH